MLLETPAVEAPSILPVPPTRRQYGHGELLLAAFLSARRPLCFSDLLAVMTNSGARISDVLEWLAGAHGSGLLDDAGYETGVHGEMIGPRRFALSTEARGALRRRRGTRQRRRAVLV
ncbi:MAG TPA: hypothetical protein VHB30_02725 [Solirubrobacteraceae bacterium]|jgi:hypothetical protein|nr:hypothetical protein [Solirubrobacteraceae bacterium]